MRNLDDDVTGANPPVRKVGAILAGVVMAAVIVFSLGVMVGKRVTGDVRTLSEPPSALPTETLRPRPRPSVEEAKESAAAPAKKSGRDGAPSEKLTFFDTLSGDKAGPPPPLPKEPPPPPRKATPAPEKPVALKAESPKAPPPLPKKAPSPPPEKASGDPGKSVMKLTGRGGVAVQVASTTNGSWANELVRRLKKKGVTARANAVTLKGKLWYRIRVGTFPDRQSANKALKILKDMGYDGMVVSVD